MKRLLIGFISLIAIQNIAHAQADVFLCVDDNGKKEYKNTGATKGCKRVELPGITVVPAPALPSAPKKTQAKSASSPADFLRLTREHKRPEIRIAGKFCWMSSKRKSKNWLI
jgi:hypothetical protein